MKKILSILLAACMAVSLAGCCLNHDWKDATCTEPKTCSKCGETEGDPLGHEWKDATCTEPKTCSRCGATEGQAAGHKTSNGNYTVDAAKLTYSLVCYVCHQEVDTMTVQELVSDHSIQSFLRRYNIGVAQVCGEFKLGDNNDDAPEYISAETKSGSFHGIVDLGGSSYLVFDSKDREIPADGLIGRVAFRREDLEIKNLDEGSRYRLYAFLYALNPDLSKDDLKSVWDYFMFQGSSDSHPGRSDFAGSGSLFDVKVDSKAPRFENVNLQARVWQNEIANLYFIGSED